MLTLKSTPLELRGIANRFKKDGSIYYLLNVENDEGTPHQLYCPTPEAVPQGLKKGDKVVVLFHMKTYNNNDYLVVSKVEKVGA